MKISEQKLRRGIRKMIREQLDSPHFDYSDETDNQRDMFDLGRSHGETNQVEQFPNDEDYTAGYAAGAIEFEGSDFERLAMGSAGDDSLYGENPGRWLD
jgi:hypothetical protein